jgi:hypothetical protein
MVLSRKQLLRVIGALWLIDGLLQLQPQMFTMNMVNGIMEPTVQNQPSIVAALLKETIAITTAHLTTVNLVIAIVQILLGVLLLSGRWVRETVIASTVWALIVWFGGEGMSMILAGQGSDLTGWPGAVLLYPLLGFAVYPRVATPLGSSLTGVAPETGDDGVVSRLLLRRVLAGFWVVAAVLQLQPYWWQKGQISSAIGAMVGQGGFNGVLVDPLPSRLATATANAEIPLNLLLILVFLGLGAAIWLTKGRQLQVALIASIVVSVVIWYFAEGFGMIVTGMATDFNSGLLLVGLALAVMPRLAPARVAQRHMADMAGQPQPGGLVQSA